MPSIKSTMAVFEPNASNNNRQKRQSYSGPPRRQSSIMEPKENPFSIQLKSVKRDPKPALKSQPSWDVPELTHVFPDVQQPNRRQSITELKRRDSLVEKQGRKDSTAGQPTRKESVQENVQPPRKESVVNAQPLSRKESVVNVQPSSRKESVVNAQPSSRKESVVESKFPSKKTSSEMKTPVQNGFPPQQAPAVAPPPPQPAPQKPAPPAPAPPPPKVTPTPPKPAESAPAPPPPPAPAPPPPPPAAPPLPGKKPMSEAKKDYIEKLKQRPRKRLDWHELMKEIETGVALKRVVTNDRSRPIIPTAKTKQGFVYASEKPNLHNQLLNEIQKGVHLKRAENVRDRSRPVLHGLRKLRRQLTVEEQQKMSGDDEIPSSEDELDDIDKIRDSLQSTKQLLDQENRMKRELQLQNIQLSDELERMKMKQGGIVCNGNVATEEWEDRCRQANKELYSAQSKLDEAENKVDMLEKALMMIQQQHGIQIPELDMLQKKSDVPDSQKEMQKKEEEVEEEEVEEEEEVTEEEVEEEVEEEEEEEEIEVEETDTDSDGDIPIMKDRSIEKEVSILETRLRHAQEKEKSAKLEKKSLNKRIVKLRKDLKVEKKRYKKLQKDVDEVAKMLVDTEDNDEEKKAEKKEEEEEAEEEEEVVEESEESEEESDYEAKGPYEDRKTKLQEKIKRSEEKLQKKKRCNYRLKAQVDRQINCLSTEREKYKDLETELNSVLAELG